MGRIHRDRALLQGTQDPAAPRERQGWHQGKPSMYASYRLGARPGCAEAFDPLLVARAQGSKGLGVDVGSPK